MVNVVDARRALCQGVGLEYLYSRVVFMIANAFSFRFRMGTPEISLDTSGIRHATFDAAVVSGRRWNSECFV